VDEMAATKVRIAVKIFSVNASLVKEEKKQTYKILYQLYVMEKTNLTEGVEDRLPSEILA